MWQTLVVRHAITPVVVGPRGLVGRIPVTGIRSGQRICKSEITYVSGSLYNIAHVQQYKVIASHRCIGVLVGGGCNHFICIDFFSFLVG